MKEQNRGIIGKVRLVERPGTNQVICVTEIGEDEAKSFTREDWIKVIQGTSQLAKNLYK